MSERTVSYEIKPVTSYELVRTVTLPGKVNVDTVGVFDTIKEAEEFQRDLMVYDR